jgi:hypothetical protein
MYITVIGGSGLVGARLTTFGCLPFEAWAFFGNISHEVM